jgi:hypothetical protein
LYVQRMASLTLDWNQVCSTFFMFCCGTDALSSRLRDRRRLNLLGKELVRRYVQFTLLLCLFYPQRKMFEPL